MKRSVLIVLLTVLVLCTVSALAEGPNKMQCETVGGLLMTNIGAIAGQTNLGPVFGDLAGSVAATILGQDAQGNFLVQHYWVLSTGETIKLKVAVLRPAVTDQAGVVPVLWGNYSSALTNGGTGRYRYASGSLNYFGIADFNKNTLVLRYEGNICHLQ